MPATNPAIGVKDLLVSAGLGTFGALTGWGIYLGRLPDKPDTCILVNLTGGTDPFPHLLLGFPSVQTIVRGGRDGYLVASQKMGAVVDALLGLPSQNVNGDRWVSVTQQGDIFTMGFDENQRPMFSANWRIIIEPASGTYRQPIT